MVGDGITIPRSCNRNVGISLAQVQTLIKLRMSPCAPITFSTYPLFSPSPRAILTYRVKSDLGLQFIQCHRLTHRWASLCLGCFFCHPWPQVQIGVSRSYRVSCLSDGSHRGSLYNAAAKEVGEAELLVTSHCGSEPEVSDWYHGLVRMVRGKRDENVDRGAYVPLQRFEEV